MPKQLYFPKLTVQRLVTLAMLIALAVIVSKFSVSIIPNQLVISFTFIVNTVIGIIAGPFWSFITLAMIDLIDSLMGALAILSFGGQLWRLFRDSFMVSFSIKDHCGQIKKRIGSMCQL